MRGSEAKHNKGAIFCEINLNVWRFGIVWSQKGLSGTSGFYFATVCDFLRIFKNLITRIHWLIVLLAYCVDHVNKNVGI